MRAHVSDEYLGCRHFGWAALGGRRVEPAVMGALRAADAYDCNVGTATLFKLCRAAEKLVWHGQGIEGERLRVLNAARYCLSLVGAQSHGAAPALGYRLGQQRCSHARAAGQLISKMRWGEAAPNEAVVLQAIVNSLALWLGNGLDRWADVVGLVEVMNEQF